MEMFKRDAIEAQPEHADEGILAEVRAAIWSQGTVRSIDLGSISTGVRNGEVFLTGHVSTDWNRNRIAELAGQAPGVLRVHNNLVVDYALTLQVAQALPRDERTRPYIINVGSSHGWISLSGQVPSHEIRTAVEDIAGSVPGVRGVVALPKVTGELSAEERRMIQPELGARVYAKDGPAGWVSEVVINPRNRMVSHIIVRLDLGTDGSPSANQRVIPVDVVDLVREGSVFLAVRARALGESPVFDPEEYPPAPLSWQPPYPYEAGTVRWLCQPTGCEEDEQLQTEAEAAP